MFRKVQPGQTYEDLSRLDPNFGHSLRRLTVMSVEDGAVGVRHPQIRYAKCRADYPSGDMKIAFIEVHQMLNEKKYRLLSGKAR